eukprot:CAMPEP_0168550344 /NCGR_PEP_ID=MMETSP0413-20121227/5587_1 /TAXON_ID=136452 /ORGANISM="Filamoeba nolandi, Strain NC-AS-23-1" /LENGTH=220 /DNA_ID=CAMNT_0008580793 /DNA_START=68 /DNA_END=726 /DNA_ORIENTATION=-
MGNTNAKSLLNQSHFHKKEIKNLKETVISIVFPDRDVEELGTTELELNREQFRKVFEECSGIKEMKEGGVDLDLVFESVDTNQNGKVSFSEIVLWLGLYKRGTTREKLQHIFQAFDTDGSGALEEAEIHHVLNVLKTSFYDRGKDSKAATELIKALDVNDDGKITIEEWVTAGEKVGLIEDILGQDFVEMINRFDVLGGPKQRSSSLSKSASSPRKYNKA